jgi:hypothetical protein
MSDIIIHKRSFDTGSVPTTHSLGIAQFAINVPDGKVFIHKSSSVSESIVSVLTTDSITTGSITLTGTASAALFIGTFTGSFSGVSTNAETSSILGGPQEFIDFVTGSNTVASKPGRLVWNDADGTLDLGLKGGTASLQIGQETLYEVRNATATPILNGTSLYANGVTVGSGRITAAPFVADGSVREVRYLGLATETIANGINGFVTHFGYVRDLDTRGTAASSIAVGDENWSVGDILYAHPTVAGKLTNVKPKHEVSVAIIITRHQSTGVLFVRPASYGHIDDIHDVNINTASLASGDLLVYDSGSDYWTNGKQLTGSYGVTGSIRMWQSASVSGTNIFGTASNAFSASFAVQSRQAFFTNINSTAINGEYAVIFAPTGSTGYLQAFVDTTGDILRYNPSNGRLIVGSVSASIGFTGSLFGTASHAISAQTASFVESNYIREYHVSNQSGDDSGSGALLQPFKTIGKAIATVTSGEQIIIHPGTYNENFNTPTNCNNVTITAANTEIGGLINITGTASIDQTIGTIRLVGLNLGSVIHSGNRNLYLQNVTVNGALSKTGNGYLEATNITAQSGLTSVTGTGQVLIKQSLLGVVLVNTGSATVNIANNIAVVTPTCQAGTLVVDGGFIYSTGATTGAVFASSGAVVSLKDTQCITPTGTIARITLNAGTLASIQNVSYDRANSVSGISLSTRAEFQQLRADGITGSFIGTLTGSVDTASFANSGFTINSSSIFSFARTSSAVGLNSFSVATGSSRGSILNYTVTSQSNGRTGQVMTSWVGSNIVYAETHTPDIGSTAGVSFTSSLSGANSVYTFGTATAGWNVEFLVTQI